MKVSFIRGTAILGIVSLASLAEGQDKPCPSRIGGPLPEEGVWGNGNVQTSITLPTLTPYPGEGPLTLVHNSLGSHPEGTDGPDRGFSVNWNLTINSYYEHPQQSELIIFTGDGTPTYFDQDPNNPLRFNSRNLNITTSYIEDQASGRYLRHNADGSKAFYEANYLKWKEDRFGKRLEIQRNGNGRIEKIWSTPFERELVFTYYQEPEGYWDPVTQQHVPSNVLKIVDKSGGATEEESRTYRLFFDTFQPERLVQVVRPDGRAHEITYMAGSNKILEHKSFNGIKTRFSYIPYLPTDNLGGSVWFVEDSDGVKTQIVYESNGVLVKDDDEYFYQRFDNDCRVIMTLKGQPSTTVTETESSKTVTETLVGIKTEYIRDALGRKTKQIAHTGDETTYEYLGNTPFVSAMIASTGIRTEYSYTGPPWYRISQIVVKDVSGNPVMTTVNAYESNGIDMDYTEVNGQRTEYTYDASGRLTETIDPIGDIIYKAWDFHPQFDAPRKTQDRMGAITERTFDSMGYVLTNKSPSGRTTTFTRDHLGNPLTTVGPADNQGRAVTITNTYNSMGVLIHSESSIGSTSFTSSTTRTFHPEGQDLEVVQTQRVNGTLALEKRSQFLDWGPYRKDPSLVETETPQAGIIVQRKRDGALARAPYIQNAPTPPVYTFGWMPDAATEPTLRLTGTHDDGTGDKFAYNDLNWNEVDVWVDGSHVPSIMGMESTIELEPGNSVDLYIPRYRDSQIFHEDGNCWEVENWYNAGGDPNYAGVAPPQSCVCHNSGTVTTDERLKCTFTLSNETDIFCEYHYVPTDDELCD